MAYGCEEHNGYRDDPKHSHAGTSLSAAAGLTTGW